MADWTFLAQRLGGEADGEIFETQLPLEGFVRGRALSAPPTASARLPNRINRLIAPDGQPLMKRWETAIYPMADGELLGQGYIMSNSKWVDDAWEMSFVGFSATPKGQPYQGVTEWPSADPADVFRHIWAHHQSMPGANFHVTVSDLVTPVRLPDPPANVDADDDVFRLNYWSVFDMGNVLDDMAVRGSFDWREKHTWANGEFPIDHVVELGRPIGAKRTDASLVYGQNVTTLPPIDDGDPIEGYATDIILLGAGEGKDRVRGYAGRPTTGIRRYKVIENEDVDSQGQADRDARDALYQYTGEPQVHEMTVDRHSLADIDALEPGDEVRYYAETEHITIDRWVKIVDIKDSPDQEDIAVVTVVPA